jgi:uncharacterized protein (TIGR01615 family)
MQVYDSVGDIISRSDKRNYDPEDSVEQLACSLAKHGYEVFLRTGPLHTFMVARDSSFKQHTKNLWPIVLSKNDDDKWKSHSNNLLIIDPCFKDHFQVGGSSEEYKQLVHLLPDVFIGTAEDVDSVAKFLCNEVRVLHQKFIYMFF